MSKTIKTDYDAVGLKCGLEIHQQLSTHKLFCDCPSILREDQPHFSLVRELRAVVGETGRVDVAAAAEEMKKRTFLYEGYTDTTCLVELDDDPPRQICEQALRVCLMVCKLLHAQIVDEIQVMRKTVVDGSNTSGFQRTALVGINGTLQVEGKKISIPTICLEEDACKIIGNEEGRVRYRLDRLGIPLIEIATGPDLRSPQEAQLAAKTLGELLRSCPSIMRGLGTIRQDVNISISGGERVEIKGAQDLKMIPQIVSTEVMRQESLVAIKKELLSGKITKNFEEEIVDLTSTLRPSGSKLIQTTLRGGGVVSGLRLQGMKGVMGRELAPGRRIGTECSERAKIHAGVGGIFHSDELPNYGIEAGDVEKVRNHLHCAPDDAFVMVCDTKEKTHQALRCVFERLTELGEGVPREVRRANDDGTTSYLRPLPGAARMYPETDVVPVIPHPEQIIVPELLSSKIVRYEKSGLSKDLAVEIAHTNPDLFEQMIKKYPQLKAAYIAETIISLPKEMLRTHSIVVEYPSAFFDELFSRLSQHTTSKESVSGVAHEWAKHRKIDWSQFATLSDAELEGAVKKIIEENKGVAPNAMMGRVMEKLRGKAAGEAIAKMVATLTKK